MENSDPLGMRTVETMAGCVIAGGICPRYAALAITNADFVIGKSFHSEILTELAETKIIASKDALQ